MKRTELRTNVPQLNGLARACHDMPKHTHEHLQGSVTFLTEKGGQKSVWKTKLAGKYVPEWCHAYASILVAIAPEEARAHSGKVAWSSSWQAQLVAATGHVTTPSINVPTCPQHSICEWAHAVSTWTHSECARSFRVVPPGRGLRLPKAPSNRCRRRKAHRCYANAASIGRQSVLLKCVKCLPCIAPSLPKTFKKQLKASICLEAAQLLSPLQIVA